MAIRIAGANNLAGGAGGLLSFRRRSVQPVTKQRGSIVMGDLTEETKRLAKLPSLEAQVTPQSQSSSSSLPRNSEHERMLSPSRKSRAAPSSVISYPQSHQPSNPSKMLAKVFSVSSGPTRSDSLKKGLQRHVRPAQDVLVLFGRLRTAEFVTVFYAFIGVFCGIVRIEGL